MELFLSDTEVDALCAPLRQPAAQVRYLRQVLNLAVATKPNGRAVVVRSHVEAVLSGREPATPSNPVEKAEATAPRPNLDAFLQVIKGGKNGPAKKVESS